MDHLYVVFKCNFDDLVASQVGTDGSVLTTLANDVGLVGLCIVLETYREQGGMARRMCTLSVHAEAILITVDGNSV